MAINPLEIGGLALIAGLLAFAQRLGGWEHKPLARCIGMLSAGLFVWWCFLFVPYPLSFIVSVFPLGLVIVFAVKWIRGSAVSRAKTSLSRDRGLVFAGWLGASHAVLLPVHWPTETEKANWVSIRNSRAIPSVDAKNVTVHLEFINSQKTKRLIVPEAVWWEIGGMTPKENERVSHAQHSVDISGGDDQAFLLFSEDREGRGIPYKDANEPLEPLSKDRWEISLLVTSDNIEGFEGMIPVIAGRNGIRADLANPFTRLRSVPPRLESIRRSPESTMHEN
jgi:hypothetical protein